MKRSALALAFALAIPSFAFASAPVAAQLPVIEHGEQAPGPHGEHKGEHGKGGPGYGHGFKQIKKELDLTDAQAKVVGLIPNGENSATSPVENGVPARSFRVQRHLRPKGGMDRKVKLVPMRRGRFRALVHRTLYQEVNGCGEC